MKSEFMNELRAAVLKKTGTLRLMGLNNAGGWRDLFTTNKPIKTPDDLKGVDMDGAGFTANGEALPANDLLDGW